MGGTIPQQRLAQTKDHSSSRALPWQRRDGRPAVRIFCFPYAGGMATVYRSWEAYLPQAVELCPVELPGHGTRMKEKLVGSVEGVLDDVVPAILQLDDCPFLLFGHSLGALLAFEATYELLAAGSAPAALVVSGAGPPGNGPRRATHRLPDDVLLHEVARLGGIPNEFLEHRELMAMILPILRNDLGLLENFNPHRRQSLPIPLAAYGGREDTRVERTQILDWAKHTSSTFEHQIFPGNHFFVRTHQELVARALGYFACSLFSRPQSPRGLQLRR